MDRMCKVPLSSEEYLCPATAAINVIFSAGNILGLGPASDPVRIGKEAMACTIQVHMDWCCIITQTILADCSNQLVTIRYDSTSSTISCRFFGQSTGTKSCYIQYGLCSNESGQFTGPGANVTSSNMTLSLKLNITNKNLEYCYRVTASNLTYTTIIEGKIGNNYSLHHEPY